MHLVTVVPGDIPDVENIATPESLAPRMTLPDWIEVAAVVVEVN